MTSERMNLSVGQGINYQSYLKVNEPRFRFRHNQKGKINKLPNVNPFLQISVPKHFSIQTRNNSSDSKVSFIMRCYCFISWFLQLQQSLNEYPSYYFIPGVPKVQNFVIISLLVNYCKCINTKLQRFVFVIVSYVMTHFSVISPNAGTSRGGSHANFKFNPRSSSI